MTTILTNREIHHRLYKYLIFIFKPRYIKLLQIKMRIKLILFWYLFGIVIFVSGARCPHSPITYPCPDYGTKHYNNWTPHWWYTLEYGQIEIVQGLPGYTPIAGKNTLVAFTPSPGCDVAESGQKARLDIFQIKPDGMTSPVLFGMEGVPAQEGVQINHNNNAAVKTNFFVDGSIFNAPGKYLFVVRSKCCSNNPDLSDSLIADFCTPAQVKILFIPMGEDIMNQEDLRKATYKNINHYLSRMPFPSSTYNSPGINSQYWDIYNGYIPFKEAWVNLGFLDLMNPANVSEIGNMLNLIKQDYNTYALQKADYVVGVYPRRSFWVYADGIAYYEHFAIANMLYYPVITHECGHLLQYTVETTDRYAALKTCGYLNKEDEDKEGCSSDWAFDPYTKEIFDSPKNVSSWDGGYDSFFSRLYYERFCMRHKGGCASPVLNGTLFSMKTLDDRYYLTANDMTGEVETISAAAVRKNTPLWRAEVIEEYQCGEDCYIKLWWAGTKDNPVSGTNTLLICNPKNGGIRTVNPDHFSIHADDLFKDWDSSCYFQHIAMGVNTFRYGWWVEGFISWTKPQASPNDYKIQVYTPPSSEYNSQFTTPFVQWKIVVNQ